MHQVAEENSQGFILRVRLSPNASCCKKTGFFMAPEGVEFLKISVVSVPEKGKANKELINYLAKALRLAKSDFEIIGGELDRYKKILIKAKGKISAVELNAWIEEN